MLKIPLLDYESGIFCFRVAEINKYAKIAPDFGSPSRRAKGSILSICDFWCNAEGGLKDKQDCGLICFRGPKSTKGKGQRCLKQ